MENYLVGKSAIRQITGKKKPYPMVWLEIYAESNLRKINKSINVKPIANQENPDRRK